jgi:hypothetical protein
MPKIRQKRSMKLSVLSVYIIIVLGLSSCVHIELPHTGIVKDAETGNPLNGVVVHMDLESGMPLGPDGITKLKGSYETVTNTDGTFSLSIKLKGQLPLELSTGHELSFFKAGYFPARILEPSLNNTIPLHRIKYYLDYSHYKESAKRGYLERPFMSEKPEAFTEYNKELDKVALLQFEKTGDKGAFITVPNAQIAKISCRSSFRLDEKPSAPYTFGVSGDVCIFFDEVSRRLITFDAQGNIKELNAPLLIKYNLFSAGYADAPDALDSVYAKNASIYIPNPPYPSIDKNIMAQKGNIVALAAGSSEYSTIEGNGLYLCTYFARFYRKDSICVSADELFSAKNGHVLFVSLTKPVQYQNYYAIVKMELEYRLYKITHSESSDKTIFNSPEQLLPSFPVDDEIIDFASNGRDFFIAFKRSGIKKYSLDMYGKGPLKERKDFYTNSHDLFRDKTIAAIELGRSVTDHVLYVTVGNSTVYRLSVDGVPDFHIRIIEK